MSSVINEMQFSHHSQDSTEQFGYRSPERPYKTAVKDYTFTEKGIKGGKLQSRNPLKTSTKVRPKGLIT